MRFCYLLPKQAGKNYHGKVCRGGVASPDGSEYVLEIGNHENCDALMLSAAAHIDEIVNFLQKSRDPMADLLLTSMEKLRLQIELGMAKRQQIHELLEHELLGGQAPCP